MKSSSFAMAVGLKQYDTLEPNILDISRPCSSICFSLYPIPFIHVTRVWSEFTSRVKDIIVRAATIQEPILCFLIFYSSTTSLYCDNPLQMNRPSCSTAPICVCDRSASPFGDFEQLFKVTNIRPMEHCTYTWRDRKNRTGRRFWSTPSIQGRQIFYSAS